MLLQHYGTQLWSTDPRWYQIIILSTLLLYGISALDFNIQFQQILVLIATALLSQYIATQLFNVPVFDARSPLISALSLCLLLRSNELIFMGLAAVITVLSKFVLRWRHKHIFNPTNFGLVTMMLLTDAVWVSPGQWGTTPFFAFLIACLGGLVINRSARSDITYAFLMCYTTIVLSRALWLGDPLAIPLHQLESGALLLFTFFMISDPKTTPDTRLGRLIFACLVALVAAIIRFEFYQPLGILWSLALCSPLVPLIDYYLPGQRYQWTIRTV